MEQRLTPKLEPGRRHLVDLDSSDRRLQRPGLVVDDCGDRAATTLSEEPVALDEEVLERPRLGGRWLPGRLVGRREARVATGAQVVDPLPARHSRHAGEPVRKAVEGAPGADEEGARRIQAQKPDAGNAVDADVRAHVQLGDRREDRPSRRKERPAREHPEGDDREPRALVPDIRFHSGRQPTRERIRVNRPVREEQPAPGLGEEPSNGYH